jgi:hypothetical protein
VPGGLQGALSVIFRSPATTAASGTPVTKQSAGLPRGRPRPGRRHAGAGCGLAATRATAHEAAPLAATPCPLAGRSATGDSPATARCWPPWRPAAAPSCSARPAISCHTSAPSLPSRPEPLTKLPGYGQRQPSGRVAATRVGVLDGGPGEPLLACQPYPHVEVLHQAPAEEPGYGGGRRPERLELRRGWHSRLAHSTAAVHGNIGQEKALRGHVEPGPIAHEVPSRGQPAGEVSWVMQRPAVVTHLKVRCARPGFPVGRLAPAAFLAATASRSPPAT